MFIEFDEPKLIKKTVIKPNLAKFGPIFKGDSPKIKTFIENADPEEIKNALDNEGKYIVELDKEYELTSDLLIIEEVEEEVSGEKIIPHVIEPSFGIDRILYCTLLHSFHTAENEKDKENRRITK